MLNELSSVTSGYAQSVSLASSASFTQSGTDVTAAPQPSAETDVSTVKRTYSALIGIKDDVAQVATSIRTADQALGKADSLLGEMSAQVTQVKNYPPFPPGNEDRVKYLDSISGLRKELQALTVPRVADSYQPVFYPRESKFPELDGKTSTDSDVHAFGEAVDAARAQVNDGQKKLWSQADELSPGVGMPLSEAQAQIIGGSVGVQLSGTSTSLVGQSDILAQLG